MSPESSYSQIFLNGYAVPFLRKRVLDIILYVGDPHKFLKYAIGRMTQIYSVQQCPTTLHSL
jgi:hypothetical protein